MKIRNWTLLITLSALACFFYFYITPVYLHPAEDATILFNYAQNLRETGVISYYPGGPAVDGSTDFLFLLLVSAAMNIVPDAYQAAMLVSGLSTMLMMFFIFRLLDTKTLSLQYLALFLVLFSQQIWAAVLGYGTFFFAMLICWSVLAYWRGKLVMLCIAGLLAVLARPDALITILPLLLHKAFAEKGKPGVKITQIFLLFVLPLALYIAGRQLYFGRILPLSFDINTDGYNKIWGLFPINSIHHVKGYAIHYIWPGLLGLALFIGKSKFKIQPGYYVLLISMIVLPMLSYLMIRSDLDHARRYFIIPYLGIVLTTCLLIRNHKSIILTISGSILLIMVVYTSFNQGLASLNHYYNNMFDIGKSLGTLPKMKIATSESGILTWKSRYEAIDLWGLNTPELTHHIPTADSFRVWEPDIVVIHTMERDYVAIERDRLSTEKTWLNMTHQTMAGLHEMGYITYLVPYDWRQFRESAVESTGLLKSFFKWVVENQRREPSGRKDLFAVHPDSPYRKELTNIIEEHGGKSFRIEQNINK